MPPSFVEVSFRGAVEAKQLKPPAAGDRRNPVFLEAFRHLRWVVVQFDFKLHNYPQVSDKPVRTKPLARRTESRGVAKGVLQG
jgi:hypothetical protein